MKTTEFKNIKDNINNEITISGFVESLRDLPYVQFIVLRNGNNKLQVTLEKNDDNTKLNSIISLIRVESTIKVIGKVVLNEKVKLNGMELIPSSIEATSICDLELPINLKEKDKTLRETRLDYRFLDLRRVDNNLLFRCQTTILEGMREYWNNNDYIEINSPKIAGASAEGGSEVFKLDYFGQPACLSQSPQLYKQMAMAAGFNKVFEIGQVFRAENSHTSYHATEILMVDAEISWIDSFDDVMDMEEAMLKYTFNKLKEKHAEEVLKIFNIELKEINYNFPRITFEEAKKIMREKYNYVAYKTDDFERKEEELMCQYAKELYNSEFIFITHYPVSSRPFYTMADGNGNTYSYDLLYKGIEITSGAQREHHFDILKQQIIDKGINPETLNNYLDFFKYGVPPHGGFGLGVSRLMMLIFNIDNIREATFIYRGPTRLNP
ncbi:MAG: aspartate--tRNA(Asn) ligase [Bacilli bacterium]|nr:aspartate--tRNA(Asn) ligase [Bacilli bacterium]